MAKEIDKIVANHKELFGKDPDIKKIKVGFTNELYNIDNKYIVKICNNEENEINFQKEIEFYNANKYNILIPKMYYVDTTKSIIPYYYEILEKVEGQSLYNVWHKLTNKERESIIEKICSAMKKIHSSVGYIYDWSKKIKNDFMLPYSKLRNNNYFTESECNLIDNAYSKFDLYLDSDDFVLVHNDLHFDNIFMKGEDIKIIDFERSLYAPRDFELDIIYRMVRKPWKFASDEAEKDVKKEDYDKIIPYIQKYYPEMFIVPNLYMRLAIYDMVYNMNQLINYPNCEEVKNDLLKSAELLNN